MTAEIPAATLEKFTTFGDLLRFLRRRVGITQMELAVAVGYSDAQISRLEQNLRLPDIPTIKTQFVHALALEDEPKTIARLLDLAANVRREDAPGLGLCPYKGLNYFDEADADLFVGREDLTSKLTERLLSLTQAGSNNPSRFLAVVGASGSGKSSLVRAGLVPSLRWNQVSSEWDIRILTPTAHPLASVAESLSQDSLADDMLNSNQSLSCFANPENPLLLVIDQFEETFALCRSEEERSAFINNLLTAATDPNGKVAVVITLRADFYAHCANYVQLREALATQQEYIGAMNEDEMRRAIEEPARRGRWEFEPGLVDLLLHDVGREPGALPLLSHALMETWQRRRARMMTLSGYASSGGVRGAIAETAESVFVDQFTPEQRAIARKIFLRLTELSNESTAGDTRRRASFNELILKPEESALTQTVLQALADARLIITSEDSAEVAHEALIREWPTLRSWLEENREGLRLHRHLTDSAQEWQTSDRESDILYRGARLAQTVEWASSHQEEMNDLEREFIVESRAHAEREAVEKEARRQRELEAAQKLAEVERQRAEEQAQAARQLRRRAVYLRLAFLAAVLLAIAAGFFGLRSQQTSQVASSRELAAASITNLESDPERSILLALEAFKRSNTLEAENALHQAVMTSRIYRVFPVHNVGALVHVDIHPNSKYIVTSSMDGMVKLISSQMGQTLLTLPGQYAVFSPDGQVIATVLADGKIKVWDADSGNEIQVPGPIEAMYSVHFSPDGKRLVTVTNGNLPRIWDVKTGRELKQFPGHLDFVSLASFSPDGSRLLTASDDKTARIWNAFTGEEVLSLTHDDWVWHAAFSTDGKRVVTSSGAQVFVWDAETGEKLFTLNGHVSTVHVAAFSPDGAMLATGSYDRKIIVWNANTGEALFTLSGHTGSIFSLAFSPDGKQLISSSDDGTLRIWDVTLERGEALTIPYTDGRGEKVTFTPNGKILIAIEGGKLKLWNVESGNEMRDFSDNTNAVTSFALSPDGSLLAVARDDFSVTLYNPASPTGLRTWSAHTGRVNTLAFSPGGKWLATASDDFKVIIWDLSEGKLVNILTLTMPVGVQSIAFNSDGTLLAIGLQNGTVRIRSFESGEDLHILRGHDDVILSLAFSPDNSLLATASLDGTAKIWDVQTGTERFALEGHTNSVTALAFNPNGVRLATSSRDGTTKIWDITTGQELLNFPGNSSGINGLAFNPDGTLLVTSGDREAWVYILQVDELAKLAQDRITRRLTQEECLKYLHEITDACAPVVVVPTITPLPATTNGRICQVTNTGGLNDNYFNELLYAGVQEAAQNHAWEASVLQSASSTDFARNLNIFADADCQLIVAPGNLAEAMQTAAQANPDQHFILMDFGFDPPLENVWVQTYAVDQAAFLAGYVAASTTKTGKVGTFGGIDIPPVTDYMDGFTLGVRHYNYDHGTNIEVIGWDAEKHEGLFTGSFCCSTEGQQAARQLLDAGADVILPVAGQSVGVGAGTEILKYGDAWVIGVDTDWTQTNPEFKDIILTSIEKRFDVSVMIAADAIANGSFTGGYHLGTLENGEVGLSPIQGITPEMQLNLEVIKALIRTGKLRTTP